MNKNTDHRDERIRRLEETVKKLIEERMAWHRLGPMQVAQTAVPNTLLAGLLGAGTGTLRSMAIKDVPLLSDDVALLPTEQLIQKAFNIDQANVPLLLDPIRNIVAHLSGVLAGASANPFIRFTAPLMTVIPAAYDLGWVLKVLDMPRSQIRDDVSVATLLAATGLGLVQPLLWMLRGYFEGARRWPVRWGRPGTKRKWLRHLRELENLEL